MPSRRYLLQSAGAIAALAATPMRLSLGVNTDVTARLARYMVAARDQALPEAVVLGCKHRILDTFGAMVSGSRMNTLRKQRGLTPDNVRSILVRLPTDAMGIVGESAMPDVNCQHLVAVALVKGAVSFVDSHDVALMRDPKIMEQRAKVTLTADETLMNPAAPRGAIVEVTLADGMKVDHFTKFPPGTKENPLSTEAVSAKTRDLMVPVLGSEKTEQLIDLINRLEAVDDIRMLRPLMTT
jgi:2-methylcitrate dehydratase PrpD